MMVSLNSDGGARRGGRGVVDVVWGMAGPVLV